MWQPASSPTPETTFLTVPDALDPRPPTLAQILESLRPHALQLVCASGQLESEVGESVLHGPGEPVTPVESGLLLLTGNRPERPETLDVLRKGVGLGYRGVVLKSFGNDLHGLVEVAEDSGIALLTTPDEMSWQHLDALIDATRSAVVSLGAHRYASVGLGDMFALANAIASSVGGATTIEEHTGQVISYSNLPDHEIDETRRISILGRQTPYRPVNKERYAELLESEGPLYFPSPSPEIAGRMAISVRAGTQVLCLIWVLTDRPQLVEGAEAILDDAAKSVALHLLRSRGQRDPERWHRTEALRSLLDGDMTPSAAATQLSTGIDTRSAVVAIAPAGEHPEPMIAAARIVDVVTLYCESWHPNALCVADSGVVYALLPIESSEEPTTRLVRFGEDLAAAIQRSTKLGVLVGVGPTSHDLSGVPQSRRMADRVLGVLDDPVAGSNQRIASIEQVHSGVVLRTIAAAGGATRDDMLLAPVRAILEHDQAHDTEYAQTVLAFLAAFRDVTRAAKKLNIHENTMRYRVRRVQELFDLDLADGDQLLVAWMQLRLLQLSPVAGHQVP